VFFLYLKGLVFSLTWVLAWVLGLGLFGLALGMKYFWLIVMSIQCKTRQDKTRQDKTRHSPNPNPNLNPNPNTDPNANPLQSFQPWTHVSCR
jgi:hypothetical protein